MAYCTYCLRPLEDGVCPGHCQPPESAPHILPPGTLLNGRYLVGAALGQGGFGITYIGRDQVLDIRVAIKEYYPNGFVTRNVGASPEVVITGRDKQSFVDRESEKFLAEARVLAKFIGEKGIVDVRDYFRANSTAYIVMEYLDGETLRDYLQHHGVQTPDQTFALLAPVMRSLDKVHQAGLIHRDISPDNIMLTRDGSVKLPPGPPAPPGSRACPSCSSRGTPQRSSTAPRAARAPGPISMPSAPPCISASPASPRSTPWSAFLRTRWSRPPSWASPSTPPRRRR